MEKTKEYARAKFPVEVLKAAARTLRAESQPPSEAPTNANQSAPRTHYQIDLEHGVKWRHDSEAEFFADYRRPDADSCIYTVTTTKEAKKLTVMLFSFMTTVSVTAPSRDEIESVFEVFESAAAASTRPPKPALPAPKPRVFIGHSHSTQWRDLKDHLQDKHGYNVEAYEVGARAGHAVRDVLGDMLTNASFALLVLTGEDLTADGNLRARQNVIHETGLFQGRLGFSRAIVLLEEGTEEFSNIEGIDQIRFAKNNIRETFGEVLATLRREFGGA